MVIDLNNYKVTKQYILSWFRANRDKTSLIDTISMMAIATHCPCIAVEFFLAEEIGFTEELVGYIKNNMKHYCYPKVLNQPSNSPFLEYS